MTISNPDIMSHLLAAEPMSAKSSIDENWLAGDSRLIIVAGSETVSATLTHIFYHIASDASQAQKLSTELDPLKKPVGSFDAQDLAGAKHLNSIINETLRLHPPVPARLSRTVPSQGIRIGDIFILGDTIVNVPFWTTQRSELSI
jgi:cytochrome P450